MARRAATVARSAETPTLDPPVAPGQLPDTPGLTRCILPGAIRVVDMERREIEVCATSGALDSYGTVFAYEASRDAFTLPAFTDLRVD